MSTTTVETKGTNKALFRTTALAGSAIIWGCLGYLALTYVPKFENAPVDVDTTLIGVRPLIIKAPPPPPVVRPEPNRPVIYAIDPVDATSTLTTRPTPSTRANPLAGGLPSGPSPSQPAASQGDGTSVLLGPIEIIAPVIPDVVPIIPDLVVPPAPPPVAKLVINPVRIAGAYPTFPVRALDRGVSGEVTMSFTVSPTGKVENINVTGEEPRGYGFARAARDAIQNWTFQPQTIDGIAVAYPARYTISFKLED